MKNKCLLIFTFLLSIIINVSAQAPANYDLIWQDEFDMPRNADGSLPLPDKDKWWFETGGHGWGNNELQFYVDKVQGTDTVAKIQDGKLIITAHKLTTPYQGKNYVSARMNTFDSWKYGYFEMKAKLPGGRGTWAAFWMMPKNFNSWPLDGEIDILEYVGYRPKVVQSTIHTQAYNHMTQTDKSGLKTIETAETEFHTYGLEWTKDKIIGYVDGEAYFTFENDMEGNKNTWPFYEPFYLKLNLAIGGDWGGLQGVDTSIFPSRYEIDYVRVYERTTPTAEFKIGSKIGFTPCSVQFTNQSLKATEYLWDFGDGNTSTEENPLHTYISTGTYTVTLIAKNENGEEKVEKKNIITLMNPVQLVAGGVIIGGNMENPTSWNISFLNSVTDGYPVATWNHTEKTPTAGQGGTLNIQGSAKNGTSVFCIYQKVNIDKNRIYKFDAAIRETGGGNLDNFFADVYISKDVEPGGSSNYNSGIKIASIQTTEGARSIYPGMDGTFQLHGDVQDFVPAESGEHFLVIKIGAIDFTGNANVFNVSLDELSLTPYETKPYTEFTAKNYQGFIPLEVTFTNSTKFGQTYNWNFGDGTTSQSTDQEVKHTYTSEGVYTVSLTAANAQGDSTMVRKDFVVVGAPTVRPKGEQLFGGNMENGAFWKVATLSADFPTTLTWNYRDQLPANGVGGCLRLQATSKNGESNVAIYQEVELSKDTLYTFDCLYKDLGASNHLWAQTYITTEEPADGRDLSITEAYTMGQLNTWVNGRAVGYDGKFSALATKGSSVSSNLKVCEYLPESDGKYYFVFKIGNTDWEGIDYKLDIALDELSLIASKSVSGIDGYKSDTLTVYAVDGSVEVKSQNNIEKVNIFSLSGALLDTATPNSNEYISRRLPLGVYVVEVNYATYKVIIK